MFHHNEVEYTDEEGTVHHKKRYKKRVFMHMGLLKEERGLDFGNGALKGLGYTDQYLLVAPWSRPLSLGKSVNKPTRVVR